MFLGKRILMVFSHSGSKVMVIVCLKCHEKNACVHCDSHTLRLAGDRLQKCIAGILSVTLFMF